MNTKISPQNLIRKKICQIRNNLSANYTENNLNAILETLFGRCIHKKHIAFYYPIGNEVDTRLLWDKCHQLGIKTYLPVICHEHNILKFTLFDKNTPLMLGKYNIPIPCSHKLITISQLDLVITPLVACDQSGLRVGLGGGFYDKTFAHLLSVNHGLKPKLLGVGWDFQLIEDELIEKNHWDVPLSGFVSQSFDLSFD